MFGRCFGTFWDILVHFEIFLEVLGQSRTFWYVLGVFWGRFGTYWDVEGHFGRFWMFLDVLRCFGMFWEA